ncbi:hypothetical protein [Fructobacillus parabroussonetiae]|uniref:Chromosome segregation ATPase n=1 Tax=Fructobacillus parabroussonetiae TaxID=2713174 RepID=A0ABS5QWD3_9LACO|nr:hypothetical protein [Fructobacillus parabroussonetiae]MBS9337521.1 hypothetical protein [Fructobacillus parabroussonetiae]
MKLPFGKKPNDDVEQPTVKLIRDKFQFNLADSTLPQTQDNIIEEVDQGLKAAGKPTYRSTMPVASMFFVELLMSDYQEAGHVGAVTLQLIESGYTKPNDKKRSKKRNDAEPVLSVLDKFAIAFTLNNEFVHLPQVIANYFMNLRNDDVGYQGRRDYIEAILDFYDSTYGQAFKGLFGLMPSESISLPSEDEWRTKYGDEKKVFVIAEKRENETDDVSDNFNEPAQPIEDSESSVLDSDNEPDEAEEWGEDDSSEFVTDAFEDDGVPAFEESESVPTDSKSRSPLPNIFSALDQVVDSGSIQAELLPVREFHELREADDGYVRSQLNRKKMKFNETRKLALDSLNQSAEKKLGEKVAQIKKDLTDQSTKFDLAHNALELAQNTVQPTIQAELDSAKSTAEKDLLTVAQNKRDEENRRHASILQEIDTTLMSDKKQTLQDLEVEFGQKEKSRIAEAQANYQAEFDNKKAEQFNNMSSQMLSELKTLATSLQNSSNEYMRLLVEEENKYLAKYEEQQRKIHIAAQKREIALQAVDIEKGKANNLQSSLDERDQQLAEAMIAINSSKQREAELQGEIRSLKANNVTIDQMELIAGKDKDTFTFKDFMEWQKLQQVPEKKKTSTRSKKGRLCRCCSFGNRRRWGRGIQMSAFKRHLKYKALHVPGIT